jgi:Protein of unknown function (DUF2721)
MLDLTTPALLFPAISLFMLAYTQRFLALANLVRQLNEQYKQTKQAKLGNNSTICGSAFTLFATHNSWQLAVSSVAFCAWHFSFGI